MVDGYYKCDRCGEFERGPIRRNQFSTDFADEKYRKISFGHRTGDDNSGSKARTVDLCEECRKDLSDFINLFQSD